jgi:hypothetical protein
MSTARPFVASGRNTRHARAPIDIAREMRRTAPPLRLTVDGHFVVGGELRFVLAFRVCLVEPLSGQVVAKRVDHAGADDAVPEPRWLAFDVEQHDMRQEEWHGHRIEVAPARQLPATGMDGQPVLVKGPDLGVPGRHISDRHAPTLGFVLSRLALSR